MLMSCCCIGGMFLFNTVLPVLLPMLSYCIQKRRRRAKDDQVLPTASEDRLADCEPGAASPKKALPTGAEQVATSKCSRFASWPAARGCGGATVFSRVSMDDDDDWDAVSEATQTTTTFVDPEALPSNALTLVVGEDGDVHLAHGGNDESCAHETPMNLARQQSTSGALRFGRRAAPTLPVPTVAPSDSGGRAVAARAEYERSWEREHSSLNAAWRARTEGHGQRKERAARPVPACTFGGHRR
jgi:hypothetical protein